METYRITGHIFEKESGLGIPDLRVRAYDKDLIFDDLLGAAITDELGKFEMLYSSKDFKEIFEKKPDIYLSVYLPPLQFLTGTKKAVRREASKNEHFELAISREKLGPFSPVNPEDEVSGGISFESAALKIEKAGLFDLPKLPRFHTTGVPGAPALPEQIQYVLLPLGGDIQSLKVIPGKYIRSSKIVYPFPAQESFPIKEKNFGQVNPELEEVEEMDYNFTPPNPKYYTGKQPYPEEMVKILWVEDIGSVKIAAIMIRPVQFDRIKMHFVFYPKLRYIVRFDAKKAKKKATERKQTNNKMGYFQAEILEDLLKADRVRPARNMHLPEYLFFEEYPHVIVTDNYRWDVTSVKREDGTTRPPTLSERGAPLDLDVEGMSVLEHFERLAAWRSARGMRSRVVSISDIIAGRYGDFTEDGFARDLQEVLRNFLKHIYKIWDTSYVLFGGDINVAPMRHLAGSSLVGGNWGHARININPPPEGKSCYVLYEQIVKIYSKVTPSKNTPLCTYHNGDRIPFNRGADSSLGILGWYFTTEEDFRTKNHGFVRLPDEEPSRFIIVEGPAGVIDEDYNWLLTNENSIPSDMYYSSLEGEGYSIEGQHDFDKNDNGWYGQYHLNDADETVLMDGNERGSEIYVGRASVENAQESATFVDKVLGYEKVEMPDWEAGYFKKILIAGEHWNKVSHGRATTSPPNEGGFFHDAAHPNLTILHSKFDISLSDGRPSYRVIARSEAVPYFIIQYNEDADARRLGWYFATDNTYSTKSEIPTRFICIKGPEEIINPDWYQVDPVGIDSVVVEKEHLRESMEELYPNLDEVERYYSDFYELPADSSIMLLTGDNILGALDRGVHLVSLSGHGDVSGCCRVSTAHEFTNVNKIFILYANSCLTARPDGNDDSLAEKSTNQANGAVAYIGYTRDSLMGISNWYEESFWAGLALFGKLGPAAGLRLPLGGRRWETWCTYAQNLFGDPAMQIWTDKPAALQVIYPTSVRRSDSIHVCVRFPALPYDAPDAWRPAENHLVTILGGWTNSSERPMVYIIRSTNSEGCVDLNLPDDGPIPDSVQITVTGRNSKPFTGIISINT